MIYATTTGRDRGPPQGLHPKMEAQASAVADQLEEQETACSPSARLAASQWRSVRTTNAIERLHEEFKDGSRPQTVLAVSRHRRDAVLGANSHQDRSTMRKVDGWQTLATKPIGQPIDPCCLKRYLHATRECATSNSKPHSGRHPTAGCPS